MSSVSRSLHSDELAYLTAHELAARIRRRDLSPVDVVDAFIRRIEARNPSLNALVYLDFDGARTRAKEAERALVAGESWAPLHGIPSALKDLFDFKPGWPASLGGIRALKHHVVNGYCVFCERMEKRGGPCSSARPTALSWDSGAPATTTCLVPRATRSILPRTRAAHPEEAPRRSPMDCYPLQKARMPAARYEIPSAWCGVYGYKASFGRVPFLVRPNAFGVADSPFLFEGPITRTVEDAAIALNVLAGPDPRDPFSLIEPPVDFTAATRRSIRGLKIAYSPDLDVFPVDGKVAATVRRAVQAFEEAGAHVEEVKLGIVRSQRELSDVWSRLYMLLNLQAIENMKRDGIDLFGKHRDDFPPEYMDWVEKTNRVSGSISSATRLSGRRSTMPSRTSLKDSICWSRRPSRARRSTTPATATRLGRSRSMVSR